MNLKGKFFISGKIETLTGLHIGGLKETLEIGGVESPVIKVKVGDKDKVYIPGSSLKGKIRCLLERKDGRKEKNGKIKEDGTPCECGKCEICKIFGPHKSENIEELARVIVRDAECKNSEIELEIKPENIIDRVKGKAMHPRNIERVPVGTTFDFEIVFNIYERDDLKLINKFIEGMELLEDDYLGGSGSRGYGKIKFKDMCLKYKPKEYYEGVDGEKSKCDIENIDMLKGLLKGKSSFEEIFQKK